MLRPLVGTLAFGLALLGCVLEATAQESVILKQSASPLTIVQYQAIFERESSGGRSIRGNPDQIRHTATYTNGTSKEIVALQIGLASFDAFNGFMGRFSGWSLERIAAGATKTGEWAHRPYAAFSFQGYGTGVAYVNAVRFADGSIWRANLTEVLTEMQKFEKELKREDLLEKKAP
jgi:hypothetical protein